MSTAQKYLTHKKLREIEWHMGEPVKRRTGKCQHQRCGKNNLRETPYGRWCFEHYVNCVECSTPDCHHPAVELRLCADCLRRDEK